LRAIKDDVLEIHPVLRLIICMSQRILVVDDHEACRHVLRALLARRAETETFEVSDGQSAIETAEALQPDVILLDLARHPIRTIPSSCKRSEDCWRIASGFGLVGC